MEQLWARKIDFCRFEICCIPMFAYGLALGDVVETDHDFLITNIYQKSGRIAIRVWINEQITQEKVEELIGKILDLDCLVEWYSQHLLGIDCDIQTKTQSLLKILDIYQN